MLTPVQCVLTRLYNSGALGDGVRTVNGTIVVTRVIGTPDVITPLTTISTIVNMTDEELADYQVFVDQLDEESTLAQALVILDVDPEA